MFSSSLPGGAGSVTFSQSSQEKTAPLARAKPFGARTAFKAAGICALALHGAALGQTPPEIPHASLSVWQAHNRSILAGLDSLNRQCTEFDISGLTPDGILDSEKGTTTGGAIRGRWQGAPFGSSHREIYLQAEYRQHTGNTNYQGYLQAGLTLTPYSATTHNKLHDFRARIGLPIAWTESTQWVPFIEYRYTWPICVIWAAIATNSHNKNGLAA